MRMMNQIMNQMMKLDYRSIILDKKAALQKAAFFYSAVIPKGTVHQADR